MPAVGNLPAGVPAPERSLGYGAVRWVHRHLRQPDGPGAGGPWRYTREQIRFLLWFYAIDAAGRWVYSSATLRRAKGWGKSPFLASLCILEFCGPCRFERFDPSGRPVARTVAMPHVSVAATSMDQTDNTIAMVRGLLAESRLPARLGLEVGKHLVQFRDGRPGRIEPVTASSRGLEGARPIFVVLDETHHMVPANQGIYVFDTNKRNVEKRAAEGSRWIDSTNAYDPNEDSVAQRNHEACPDWHLYDSLEAPPVPDLKHTEAVRSAVAVAYGDSRWVDPDAIVRAIQDPRTTASVARRFFLNQICVSEDTWMDPAEWRDRLDDTDPIVDGDRIAIGFDGSIRGDATGLVGCRLRDGKLFLLGLWTPDADREVDVLEIEAAVETAFTRFDVQWMYADPPYWQDTIGRWALTYGEKTVYEFWTNRPTRMVNATERFRTAVTTGDLRHDGNTAITRHVLNCAVRQIPQGTIVCKDNSRSKRKIDLAVCAILAWQARADAITDGRLNARRSRVAGW